MIAILDIKTVIAHPFENGNVPERSEIIKPGIPRKRPPFQAGIKLQVVGAGVRSGVHADRAFDERIDRVEREPDPFKDQTVGPVTHLRIKMIGGKVGHAPASLAEGLPGDILTAGNSLENSEHLFADSHLVGEFEDEILFFLELRRGLDLDRLFRFGDIDRRGSYGFRKVTALGLNCGFDRKWRPQASQRIYPPPNKDPWLGPLRPGPEADGSRRLQN